MSTKESHSIDYVKLGEAIRGMRAHENTSQAEFAESVGLSRSTLMQLENGRKVQRRMIDRICDIKGIYLDGLLSDTGKTVMEGPLAVHRGRTATWNAHYDHRKVIPEDNHQLIQDSEERLRLLRLGLVDFFVCSMQFILPEGPASLYLEIGLGMGRVNDKTYKDAIMHCLSGTVRFKAEGQNIVLEPGDFVGYRNDLDIDITPIEPLSPHFEPPKLMWVGGNRIGRLGPRPLRKR